MKQTLELALEALETAWYHVGTFCPTDEAIELYDEARAAIKEALAQPEEEKLHPVHIGVDVTKEGTAVTAFYRKPDSVMEMFYSQFHPLAQPEQEPDKYVMDIECTKCGAKQSGILTVNTTPPHRKPLTDEQIDTIWHNSNPTNFEAHSFARAIEAAHGIK